MKILINYFHFFKNFSYPSNKSNKAQRNNSNIKDINPKNKIMEINKPIRIIVSIISIGVIFSTLFIKQHAFVDIIGSILVAVIACNLSSIWIR